MVSIPTVVHVSEEQLYQLGWSTKPTQNDTPCVCLSHEIKSLTLSVYTVQ